VTQTKQSKADRNYGSAEVTAQKYKATVKVNYTITVVFVLLFNEYVKPE